MSAWVCNSRAADSFVGCVVARVNSVALASAVALGATSLAFHLLMARYFDFATDQWAMFVWSGVVITSIMAIGVMAATLCADEMSRRALSPALAYPLCLFVVSVVSGVAQWYVRAWCGISGLSDGDAADAIRNANIIYMALDTLVWGAFAMLAHTHRQRELGCRQQVDKLLLDRLQHAQQLARSRLVAAQSQVDPDSLLQMLGRIKHSYEIASPDAEPLLEELIAQLRERSNAASAPVRGSL